MKGHLRERSPGRWAIVIDTRDGAGRRKLKWFSFVGNKRAAQVECARLISEITNGTAAKRHRFSSISTTSRTDNGFRRIDSAIRKVFDGFTTSRN